ncbi:amidohydrolase family protein [Herbiconiux liukaitaii]|uniref:amidohydrolase family protein n=1 Tax=Herbiconiux liukaitaii TaxID=3342799 RepID=UPI0035BAA684
MAEDLAPATRAQAQGSGRLLIRGAAVASVDPLIGDLERADILVEHGRIVAVSAVSAETGESELAAAASSAEVIDAPEMIAIMYVGNYAGALDALNSGITSLVDYCHNILDPECAHGAVSGLLDAGIGGLYGHGMSPVTSNTWSESAGGREGVADPAAFEPRARLAREIREQYFRDESQPLRFGMAPQELPIAPVAAVEAEEWELLRGTGTAVSVCAETEMQMGMGFPAIREATEFTPGPSLGIDCVSGDSGDLLSHARLVLQATRWRDDAAGYERLVAPQEMRWTTKDALRWITQNGATAAGVGHEVGSLTPGKRADIVLLDMSGISQAGWNRRDPTGAVIAQTNSGTVDTVLVGGRIVKRHGRLVHVDVEAALARTRASHDHLYEQMDRNGGFIPQPPVDIPLYRERA